MWTAIIATILGLAGLVWLGWALFENWKSSKVRSWPRTEATVLSAAVEVVEAGSNSLIDPQSISLTDPRRFKAKVAYRYGVMGRQAVSEKFMYGKEYFNAREIKTLMAPVQQGQTVSIFYNPDNFDEAYIYDNSKTKWAGIWGGIILIILSLILFALAKKGKKKSFYDETSIQISDDPKVLMKERNRITKRSADIDVQIQREMNAIDKLRDQLNLLTQSKTIIDSRLRTVAV